MQQVAFEPNLGYTPKVEEGLMKPFLQYLKGLVTEIDQGVNLFLDESIEEVEKNTPKLLHLARLFQQSCKGGKRLRGSLVVLGYELAGAKFTGEILKPAAAFEIFQTAILAHDDIMDLSPIRRGKPTFYRQLGGNHYAISQTITMGDLGFFYALKLLNESDFPDARKNLATRYFVDSMLKTGLGQMLDVELSSKDYPIEEKDALKISHYKTAHYTIIGPLSVGAILGGADNKLLGGIEEFGKNLGIAFQIQDDILGVFGSEKDLGKSVTSDIEEGKATLLVIYALGHAKESEKKYLQRVYGKRKLNKKDLKKVKEIFISSGALDFSKGKAVEYVRKAKEAIPLITKDKKYQNLLNELADFLIMRNR